MHALNVLILFYNSYSFNDVYYSVAEILLKNIHHLFRLTIYDWAELCHVSTATISRFCQKLGYKSFHEFKLELSSAVDNYYVLNQFAPINQLEKYDSEQIAYLSIMRETIDDIYKTVDLNRIDQMADMLHQYDSIRIYTHGVSVNESSLQSNLIMSGRQAKAIWSSSAQLKDIETLTGDALVLLTLPNVYEKTLSLDILQALKDKNIPILLFTNSKYSQFLKYADFSYCFNGIMTQLDDTRFSLLISLLAISYRRKYLQNSEDMVSETKKAK